MTFAAKFAAKTVELKKNIAEQARLLAETDQDITRAMAAKEYKKLAAGLVELLSAYLARCDEHLLGEYPKALLRWSLNLLVAVAKDLPS